MSYFNYFGKKIFYREEGKGEVCIFLHGNTASSKMFDYLLELYTDCFKAVLIDFLGNGNSERVTAFPDEMWIDWGHQVVELCKKLSCGKVNLIGTSGGAYAAINAALERPDLFNKIVADSFDGSSLHKGFADSIIKERSFAKSDEMSRGFYEWCQGKDWEAVIDMDTEALINYERKNIRLFNGSIEEIKVPTLITFSRSDEMLFNDVEKECIKLNGMNPIISYKIYDEGGHPLIMTRAENMAETIKKFILS